MPILTKHKRINKVVRNNLVHAYIYITYIIYYNIQYYNYNYRYIIYIYNQYGCIKYNKPI